jgi:RNA polymerase sigma factor (sigma-70 family)
MITLTERDKLFKQYKPVADRAARGFWAMCHSTDYEFEDIQQEAYIALLNFVSKDNSDVRYLEPCMYKNIRQELYKMLNTKKDGVLTAYQKKKGFRLCSTEALVDVVDLRHKTDIELQIDIDTAKKLLNDQRLTIFEMYLSGYTMQEIGKNLDMSKQRVSQIYIEICKKLKNYLTK